MEGTALFYPFVWLFGVSPRDAERGIWQILIFCVAGFQSLLDFHPAFHQTFVSVKEAAQNLGSLSNTCFVSYKPFFLTQGISKRKDLTEIPKIIFHIKPIP